MVNKQNENDSDIEITNEHSENEEAMELQDTEEKVADKIKQLRHKLQQCEEDKRAIREESSRVQADFLNARKRLAEEQIRDHERQTERYIEVLLPVCDSFTMALGQPSWQTADPAWKNGIEGIYTQLQQVLTQYDVTLISPMGAAFDPNEHEAVGQTPVEADQVDTIVSVVQPGYVRVKGGQRTIIRPARVIIGSIEE